MLICMSLNKLEMTPIKKTKQKDIDAAHQAGVWNTKTKLGKM